MKFDILSEYCFVNMGQSPASETYNNNADGLPFYQGNADFGEIHPQTRIWCSAPVKIANKGDLLISVRAPIGALNIATEQCCIGRGLAALTPKLDKCRIKYIYFAIQSQINFLIANGTGSTFKAVNKNTLENLLIPVSSLNKQDEIVNIFEKLNNIINKRKEQLLLLDNAVKSRFIEMFGDPVKNEKNLPLEQLSKIGILERGKSQHRPRNAPELLGGPYPLIQTGDVSNSNIYITTYSNTYSELGLKQSKLWEPGTLCITIAANIAQTAILTFKACFPDSVVGFIPNNNTNIIFIHYWFELFQKVLEEQAPQVAQKNINLKILSELKVILPSIELQNEFADFVKQTDKSKFVIQKLLNYLL